MYEANDIEKRILGFWKENGIYGKVKEKNKGKGRFYFCDGPPYATGQIHPGTAWNKCIKDVVCRYKRARSYDVRSQAGYDTHGLPIEVKVEEELKLSSKKDIEKIGVGRFVSECKRFATQYMGVMNEQFLRIGVWMDFDNPYITYTDRYIESSWKTLKSAWEKGLLEKGESVLPYCPRCETTIANYELEYGEEKDPSIYVKFEVSENEFLVIWTTTPWTLIGNMAVMAHPNYRYVKVGVNGEKWIIAKERLDTVMEVCGNRNAVILSEFAGKEIDGLEYKHPLEEEAPKEKRKVVMSEEFVVLDEGTGLVHCAPGHGPQDFVIGKRYGLKPFCPVLPNGRYGKEAGKYAGMFVKDADKIIIEDLKNKGLLVHSALLYHRYPHCWRCKTPLIFILTEQWFIKITEIKEKLISEIEKVKWQPDFAKTWFKDFVISAPDWCISRQRYWGIPLPIWICEKCKKTKLIDSKKELGKEIKELHRPFVDEIVFRCECGGEAHRIRDVLDVWFDSGNAVWASLTDEELYSCDFIVEGKDQIRGWFYSLLGLGVVLKDEVPYKSLLMHGFFVDEKGEKMSKSLGNFVPLEDIVDRYGADTFRLWSLSNTIWEDLRFNWNEVKDAHRVLSIFWNLHIFLDRFLGERKEEYENEDLWLLSKLNSLILSSNKWLDEYEIHEFVRACRAFIVEDLSRFYLKIAKKRIFEKKSEGGVYMVLYHSLLALLKLLTPITPFITEEIYQRSFRKFEEIESISLFKWPSPDPKLINGLLEKEMDICKEIIGAIATARQNAKIKLRWALDEVVILTPSTEVKESVKSFSYAIRAISNVKDVKIGEEAPGEGYTEANFDGGKIYLKTKFDKALYSEAISREVSRRIQIMRKDMGMIENDVIRVNVIAPPEFIEIIEENISSIAKETRAKEVILSGVEKLTGTKREWDIEGQKINIIVEKV